MEEDVYAADMQDERVCDSVEIGYGERPMSHSRYDGQQKS